MIDKQLKDFLTVNPNASLQDYYRYLENCEQEMVNEKEANTNARRDYFNDTYLGKYVIINHNGSSYTVAGPVEARWFENTGVKPEKPVIDIYVNTNEKRVSYEINKREINGLWLYFPIKRYGDYRETLNHKVSVISDEKYNEIFEHAKACLQSEREYVDEITKTIVNQ